MQGQIATVFSGILLLTACTTSPPLEERHTADDLREMLSAPFPRCEQYELEGWRTDPSCKRNELQKRALIREALERLHAADVAAAPSCVRDYQIAPETLRKFNTDLASADAVPDLITHGLVIASLGRTCAVAVCNWRKRMEPAKQSPYCEIAASSETQVPD